jgi:hypothetical protein
MTFYDNEFIEYSKKIIPEKEFNNEFRMYSNDYLWVDYIQSIYPFSGSRINFSELENSVYYKICNENIFDYIKTITERNKLNVDGHIIYIGDNLIHNVYTFKLKYLLKLLPAVMEIPQHHYFCSEEEKWCINISFENDLQFGFLK